ncbi:hypothetical protein LguiA_028832 [Lonicera macranthoides]
MERLFPMMISIMWTCYKIKMLKNVGRKLVLGKPKENKRGNLLTQTQGWTSNLDITLQAYLLEAKNDTRINVMRQS